MSDPNDPDEDPLGTRLRLIKHPGELPPEDEVMEATPVPAMTHTTELVATFVAWNRSYQGGRDGEIFLTLTVPLDFKYEALKVTDEVGVTFEVSVYRRVTLDSPPDSPDSEGTWTVED